MTRVLEGTWEEIKTHDAELTGLRLRVIVEPADQEQLPPNSIRDKAHLEQLLLEGLNSGPGIEMNDEYWRAKKQRLIEQVENKAGGH